MNLFNSIYHFENAFLAHSTVMTSIGLDASTLVAVAHTTVGGTRVYGQVASSLFQKRFGRLFRSEHVHFAHVCLTKVELVKK